MINNKKVGKAICQLRRKQKLTQKGLADKIKVSDKAISKWERGLGLPDISLLNTLAMVLDTDVESLLEGNISYRKENWYGLLNLNDLDIDVLDMIFDKHLITYQLSYFMLAGIRNIYIICDGKTKNRIKGKIFNERISLILISDMKEVDREKDLMVITRPLFLYGQNVTRSFQKAMERKKNITVLSLPEHISSNIHIRFDSNHLVVDDDHAMETAYDYNALPIMFFPEGTLSYFDSSLYEMVKHYEEKKALYTEPVFRGVIYIPLMNDQDIKDASDIVRVVQKRDYPIADLDEIALRRGL